MLQLQVNHTWGQIGINRTPGRFEMQNPGYTLDMSVTQAKVIVSSTLPKVTIDQSQCFSEAGLKGNVDLTAEMVNYSKNAMLSSIGRIAEQGNQLADLPNAETAIMDQAYSNAFEQFDKEFDIGTIPKSRPRIELIRGEIDVKVTEGQVTNSTVPKNAAVKYQVGKVEAYLKQQPSIETRFVDVKG